LRVRLFHRTTRSVTLTADGKTILEWSQKIIDKNGRLVRVLPEYRQDAHVSAIYSNRLDGSGRLRACVAFLREWFGAICG
jgi:DNA-binding transcriptional LysR family regulator